MLARALELRRLRAAGRLDPEALAALRLRKLRAVLAHAYDRVPLYRELFRAAGAAPADVRSLDDLARLPIVTRRMLREAGDAALAAGGARASGVRLRTSGTTGEPLQVTVTPAERLTRLGVDFRCLVQMGLRPRDRLAVVGPWRGRSPHLHERLGLYRTEILTIEASVEEQIEGLRRFQPTVLWSYADPLHAILHRLDYRLSRVARPRVVIVSASNLTDVVRDRLRDDLGHEPLTSYGCMEVGRIAAACPRRDGLHVNADHVIVECVEDGDEARVGARRVVLTGLNQLQMPFVRYRIGDWSAAVDGACACGSSFPRILAPLGREDDMMVLPSGCILASWKVRALIRAVPELDQYRLVQHARDRLEVSVVVQGDWPREAEDDLVRRMAAAIAEPVSIEVRRVAFMRPAGAKLASFVSHVPIPEPHA